MWSSLTLMSGKGGESFSNPQIYSVLYISTLPSVSPPETWFKKIDFAFALLNTNNDLLLLSTHSCRIPPGLIQWFIENEHIDLPLPFPSWLCRGTPGPNFSSSIWYLKPYRDWASPVENKLLLILVKLNWFSRTGLSLMVMSWPLSSWWKKVIDWSCSECQRSNAQSARHEPQWDSWVDFVVRFKIPGKKENMTVVMISASVGWLLQL